MEMLLERPSRFYSEEEEEEEEHREAEEKRPRQIVFQVSSAPRQLLSLPD